MTWDGNLLSLFKSATILFTYKENIYICSLMKVLFLIVASDDRADELYSRLQYLSWRRYIHSRPGEIEAYFYKANPNLNTDFYIEGDTVYVKCIEEYPRLMKKFWLVLKAFESRLCEFDYICRPVLSSFIVLDRYLEHLKTLPRQNMCLAYILPGQIHTYNSQSNKWCWNIEQLARHGEYIYRKEDEWKNEYMKKINYEEVPFPHGGLFTITSDIGYEILNNTLITNNEGIDDACVGYILHYLKAQLIHYDYVSIYYPSDYKKLYPNNTYYYRVQHSSNRTINDINIHNHLLDIYYPNI